MRAASKHQGIIIDGLGQEGAICGMISHSGRTRSFDLSKLIASITARGDRSGEREPCTSYGLFGE